MNIVLAPQGSAVNMVLVPQENFVEIVAFAGLLDARALICATEHLRLAVRHYPRRAALLEIIAPEYRVHVPEFAAAWAEIQHGFPRSTRLALILSAGARAHLQAAHGSGADLKLMASRRAAMEWFEQIGVLPPSPQAGRMKKFGDWLSSARMRDLLPSRRRRDAFRSSCDTRLSA